LRGGIASAKLSDKAAALIKHQLKALNIVFCAALFAAAPASGAGAGASDEDDLFEEAATESDLAEAEAAAAEGRTVVRRGEAAEVNIDDI